MTKKTAKKPLWIIWVLLCCGVVNTQAQDATMADLKGIFNKLKAMKTYSYQTEKKATFPNGKKDRQVTTVYMDGEHKRLCYKNNAQVLLLTGKWAFKADHLTRNVSVFNVVKYNDKYKKALPELDAVFKGNLAATFMDSVVLRNGILKSAKRKADITTYTLGFPPDFYVEEIVLVYDHTRQLPQSITIRSFYASEPTRNRAKGTTYETVSSHYTPAVADQDFDTNRYFQLKGTKVVLSQFKNYKVTAIL